MPQVVTPQRIQADHLAHALAAAARGWHVFPLRPDDKRPAVRDWETRATVDPDRIRRCWTAGPYGVGIACGPSCLVVADLDMPKPGQIPPPEWDHAGIRDGADVFAELCEQAGQPWPTATYAVTTGRGGVHFYFGHPADGPQLRNTAGTLGWLIDTRAHGGYVVAAGSTAAGRLYSLLWDADVEPLPDWLAERLRPAPLPVQRPVTVDLPTGRAGAYLDAAIGRQLDHLRQAAEGERNRALYVSAVALGQLAAGGALPVDQAAALLEDVALSIGLARFETLRTIRSGLAAGARRPRTVAA
jgi:hypothetical protein